MEDGGDYVMDFEPDVFENKFIHWSKLPSHVKIQVLRNLPYPTLRNFMFLSKECWALASMFKTEAYAVYLDEMAFISELQDTPCEEKSMDLFVYYIPPDSRGIPNSHKTYQLSFVEDEDGGCSVRRVRGKRGRKRYSEGVRYSNETYFSASMRAFFQLTKFIEAEELAIEMHTMSPEVGNILRELPLTPSFSCKSFLIRTEDKALPPLLLPFIAPGCKLAVYSFPFPEPGDIFMNTAFFDSEVLRAAPSFDTEALTGVTEEQLLLLQGSRICMKAPNISSKGINGILRAVTTFSQCSPQIFSPDAVEYWLQWFEGQRRIELISLRETQILNHNEVLDSIDPVRILSWAEVLRNFSPTMREQWEHPNPGFRAGIRNRSGILVVVNVGTNYCDITDPFLNE
ncbi:F-box domain protein [Ancylostoma caninum]|uniref:F-box domain protein n=1 Tax=Ancylostoma caninum TaxID=29170 RepID=A0A368H432_ANCCA|nr:F-box domain protein [Ancylostoma caninum]